MSTTSTTTNIPAIGEADIRARVGEQSLSRGRPYFRDGWVFNTRRQGMTLKADCQGQQAAAYRIAVTFDERGIADAECSCPVGGGGYCKHVAAVLLAWVARPGDFTAVEEVDAALERRSKAELIALVKQMLRQRPELELLLEAPLPAAGKGGKRRAPVSPETYRRQAAAVFRHSGYEWGSEGGVAGELLAITAIGDGFAEGGDWAGAAAVYGAVATESLDNYEMFDDEAGELGEVVTACVAGLGRCLAGERDDAAAREAILRALFDIYHADVELGGLGLSDEVPDLILEHATADERRAVAGWIREGLPQGGGWSANFHRQVYGGFLLDLEADTLDDETFLRVCRETGRVGDLVDRLLDLGRTDDAIAEARHAGDYELLGLADIFVGHNREEEAERLVLERSRTSNDTRLPAWLKDRYKARGDAAAALTLAEQIFRQQPSLEGYKELRELARPLGRWETLRAKLLTALEEDQQGYLPVQIHLLEFGEGDEEAIDRALEALQRVQPGGGYGYSYHPALQVAKAAEATRPRAALAIYRQHAEGLIAARGRDRYREACAYLGTMRDLYDALGERDTWTSYLTTLRERNRTLRALQEELATAGL